MLSMNCVYFLFLSVCTSSSCLFQLLLTFDPILVEKVANLLYLVMQDNPNLQRLYLTGIFFFIMMYTGSNVLPVARLDPTHTVNTHTHTHTLIGLCVCGLPVMLCPSPRFLKYTHLKQAFKSEEVS